MATFLDVTGLQHFSNLFAFLFVWLIVYAVLSFTKVIGDNQLINALIGLLLGLFALFSPFITNAIIFIAPWFGLLFVFIMLIMVVAHMFGTGADMAINPGLRGIVLVIIIIIFVVGGLVYARDQISVPEEIDEDSDYSKITNVLFHPKFIGVVFILIIAVFTIGLLASKPF